MRFIFLSTPYFHNTHFNPKPCKCCTINRTTSSSLLWTIFLFRWLLLSPLVMHSPLEVLVSPSLPLEVRFDLCISDSRSKERRALFCGGGDSPPFCSSSDEARVAEDHEDSQFWTNSQWKKRPNDRKVGQQDKDSYSTMYFPSYCELTSSKSITWGLGPNKNIPHIWSEPTLSLTKSKVAIVTRVFLCLGTTEGLKNTTKYHMETACTSLSRIWSKFYSFNGAWKFDCLHTALALYCKRETWKGI